MKQDLTIYAGIYYFFGLAFDVKAVDGNLFSALIGVPEGYEIPLAHLGGHNFRMVGGPLPGAPVSFMIGADGRPASLMGGGYELRRVEPEELAGLEMVERLTIDPLELNGPKQAAFAALVERIEAGERVAEIDYDLPYPKYQFVQYLTSLDRYIFHGSGKTDIEIFEPVRKSVELHDSEGRGNLQAVYGTHEGLWSMFFAVVDRGRLLGSIRNGVMDFENRAGERLSVYNFSINKDQLADRPYHAGMLYLLPRATFRRLELFPGAPANEWASGAQVEPVAKLRIAPEDFPFLDRIGGHDDGPLIRSEILGDRILGAAETAEWQGPDSLRLALKERQVSAGEIAEYIELQAVLMPTVRCAYSPGPQPALVFTGLPPAYRQILETRLRKLLE